MKATRNDDGNFALELTPEEAHVLAWGGPKTLVSTIEGKLRQVLVDVEDNMMSHAEYGERFTDLEGVYASLRDELATA